MAKAKGLNVELAPHLTNETVNIPKYRELSLEEREALRDFFNSPLWEKVLNNARCEQPTNFPEGLNTALGLQIGNNQLHKKQGWQMFEVALVKQVMPPVQKKKAIPETYPDAGRIDYTKPEEEKTK
jgi:hypothetical protein